MKCLFLFVFLGALGAAVARAHPVPFKGSISLMAWNQPFMNETMVTHSFHRRAAAAGLHMRMDMEDGEMVFGGAQANLLVRRWNGDGHQANIYTWLGGGAYEMDGRRSGAAVTGLEADYETRLVYTSAKFTALLPGDGEAPTHIATLRIGKAAYPAEFDQVSHWLILDVQQNTRLEHPLTVTPVLRTFYRNVLTEIGVSLRGQWMLNLMVHI